MRYSIRKQMMIVFASLLGFVFLAIFLSNLWLLEPYYIRDKKNHFLELQKSLQAMENQGRLDISDEKTMEELVFQAEKDNLVFFAIDTEKQTICTNVRREEELQQYLKTFVLGGKDGEDKILEHTEHYEISQTKGRDERTEYLMMRGTLDGGCLFLIQSPLESIRDSIDLTNGFLVIVAILVAFVSVMFIWFFSKKMTDPLRELTVLSERMAEQDFEARYTSSGATEIDTLGENYNRMSEKLKDAISDLKNANYKLQQDIKNKERLEEMRNDFLGNVSHELKTPIALIQGYAEGLKEGVSEDVESREFYCDVIMDEARKMNQMVKNLLTLNQLEFGDNSVEYQRFDLTSLIRGVVQSMEYFSEKTNAKVQFLQKDPVFVWADEYQVEQVMTNYLKNAFNHVSGDRVIEIKMQITEDKVRTTIFNTGERIPEEALEHLWEKFYKVDKAHTREYGGNGIGLSIVKAIMNGLHQEYGVLNYDNGVAFWFDLGLK